MCQAPKECSQYYDLLEDMIILYENGYYTGYDRGYNLTSH